MAATQQGSSPGETEAWFPLPHFCPSMPHTGPVLLGLGGETEARRDGLKPRSGVLLPCHFPIPAWQVGRRGWKLCPPGVPGGLCGSAPGMMSTGVVGTSWGCSPRLALRLVSACDTTPVPKRQCLPSWHRVAACSGPGSLCQPRRALAFLSAAPSHGTLLTCPALRQSQLPHALTSSIFVPTACCSVPDTRSPPALRPSWWPPACPGLAWQGPHVEPWWVLVSHRGDRTSSGHVGGEDQCSLPTWVSLS